MEYLIGLDIGTSSVKGVLLSTEGGIQLAGKEAFVYDTAEGGSVEIPAERYLESCCKLLRALSAAVPEGGKLLGICAASASGNLLLLDEQGQPSTPIYSWQDQRTTLETAQVLGADFDSRAYYTKTGWTFLPNSFPLAMLCWLKVHSPALLEQAVKVCMSTEYLFHRLTGAWGIGGSAGTTFYLIHQESGKYLQETLKVLGIPEEKLPPVGNTGELLGHISKAGADLAGLPEGTPVYLGTFDHPAAARAAGVLQEGQLLLSCGTSWVCLYPLRHREQGLRAGLLVDPFLRESEGPWAGMTSLASISARIEDFIRRYIASTGNIFDVFAQEAAKSAPGAGGLQIDLYSDAPITGWETCHIARAVMEAVARLLLEQMEKLRAFGIHVEEATMVGGPSECPLWAQVLQEITGLRIHTARGAHTGAVGAAIMAGISAGVYNNEADALKKMQ